MGATLENYQDLANAIVHRAVLDYQRIFSTYLDSHGKRREEAEWRLETLRRFFRSEWYRTLTKVDGEWLMRRADAEVIKMKGNRVHAN